MFRLCRVAVLFGLLLGAVLLQGHRAAAEGPPTLVITLSASLNGDIHTFTGQVSGFNNAADVSVQLGGLLNQTLGIGDHGAFLYLHNFPPGTSGSVTAVATEGSETSNTAYVLVYKPSY